MPRKVSPGNASHALPATIDVSNATAQYGGGRQSVVVNKRGMLAPGCTSKMHVRTWRYARESGAPESDVWQISPRLFAMTFEAFKYWSTRRCERLAETKPVEAVTPSTPSIAAELGLRRVG